MVWRAVEWSGGDGREEDLSEVESGVVDKMCRQVALLVGAGTNRMLGLLLLLLRPLIFPLRILGPILPLATLGPTAPILGPLLGPLLGPVRPLALRLPNILPAVRRTGL